MGVDEIAYQRLYDYAMKLVDELEDASLDWKAGTPDEPIIRRQMNAKRGYLKRLRNKVVSER